MKIIIYDTEHFETTYALLRVLDTPNYRLTLFTDLKTAVPLRSMLKERASHIEWVIKGESHWTFAFKVYRYCKKNPGALLLLNTVSYHHLFFGVISGLLRSTPSILTIHGINDFFTPLAKPGIRGLVRFAGKKLLARSVTGYAVLLQATKEYIHEKFKPEKPVYIFPGAILEESHVAPPPLTTPLKIVVGGSIDQFRRNYDIVFELAAALDQEAVPTEIVLLGAAVNGYGKSVLSRARSGTYTTVRFKTYEEFVSQEEYDTQVQTCHFLLAPLEKKMQKPTERTELYGLTVCSGSFFDAVKYAKPILVPSFIPLSAEIRNQCIPFHSIESLTVRLSEIDSEERYLLLSEVAKKNAQNFSIEKVRAGILKQLEFANMPTSFHNTHTKKPTPAENSAP